MPRAQKSPALSSIPLETLDGLIHTIRGERVILDADLARLYGVPTKALNQAVRRNRTKFPPDFLFQFTAAEAEALNRSQIATASSVGKVAMRSQIVTASKRNVRHPPYAFTEHGALMAANLLNSPAATQMSVFVIRAFVRMRSLLTDTRDLAKKLAALEAELTARLDNHDVAITEFMGRLMQLLDPPSTPPPPPDKELGFHTTLKRSTPQK